MGFKDESAHRAPGVERQADYVKIFLEFLNSAAIALDKDLGAFISEYRGGKAKILGFPSDRGKKPRDEVKAIYDESKAQLDKVRVLLNDSTDFSSDFKTPQNDIRRQSF